MESERVIIPDSVAQLSEDQSQMILSHENTLVLHNEEIHSLKDNFGVFQPSIDITTDTQYFQVLDEIRAAAQAKRGPVCSTIRLKSAELPLILPCPQALGGREITIVKMANPMEYCALWTDALYIRTTLPGSSVGILTPGSKPFNNFYYTTSSSAVPQYPGCRAFKLSPDTTDMFTALRNIDCSQSFTLTFRSVRDGNVDRWLLMNVSNMGAVISPADARRWNGAVKQVRGEIVWTPKFNAYIIPRTYITANYFTVTDEMGSITWAGTSSRNAMTVPTTLPDGFRFEVQNNSTYTLALSGTTIAGGIKTIPSRSICGVKKEGGTLIIWIILESLDTSTGKK